MPIVVDALPLEEYVHWTSSKIEFDEERV
jgi:hypothetical protein